MDEEQALAYVQAAAQLQRLPLDAARARAVAVTLARTAAMARQLDAVALPPELEPAEVYRPAPFPDEEGSA